MGFLVYGYLLTRTNQNRINVIGAIMKITIRKNEIRKMQRRTWQIKPYTRIIDDDQKYNRSFIKKTTREILDEEFYFDSI